MSVSTKYWRFLVATIFYRFLGFKISQFPSEFQNIPEIGCVHIQNRFLPNFNLLKTHIFLYITNINFGQIIWGDLPCRWQIGHFFSFLVFFFESEFWLHPKNSGLNPRNFQFWGYPGLGLFVKSPTSKLTAGSASACDLHSYGFTPLNQ